MRIPDERVVEVCQLGPTEGEALLAKAQAGDFNALADWTVWSAYRKTLRRGVPQPKALHDTREIMKVVDLKLSFIP